MVGCVVWYVWLYISLYIWGVGVVGLIVLNIVVFIDMWLYVSVGWCVFVVVLYGSALEF